MNEEPLNPDNNIETENVDHNSIMMEICAYERNCRHTTVALKYLREKKANEMWNKVKVT